MPILQTFTIELDTELATRLRDTAKAQKLSPEILAAECVAQQLEIALRHRVLVDRFEAMDANLATLATFVGEATQSGGGLDLTAVCRYGRGDRKAK